MFNRNRHVKHRSIKFGLHDIRMAGTSIFYEYIFMLPMDFQLPQTFEFHIFMVVAVFFLLWSLGKCGNTSKARNHYQPIYILHLVYGVVVSSVLVDGLNICATVACLGVVAMSVFAHSPTAQPK